MSAIKMPQRPAKPFLAVTMITVIAIATVFIVYAVVLSTITGSTVTVSSVQGTIYYTKDNSTWTTTLGSGGTLGNGTGWWARLNLTSSGYTGGVTVNWILYYSNGTAVSGATQSTGTSLSGSPEAKYASPTGTTTSNKNWGTYTTTTGDYYLKAVINAP